MADNEPVKAGPVVLRIKLRYDDVETMVHRFAPNVGKSGLFLPTRSLQPIGAEIKFELRLANDQPVLVGMGRVKAVREPDPAAPKAPFGMAIELMRVTRESREVIMRMLERRKTLGLAEVAIPLPEENVPEAPKDSGPVLTAARRQSGPIAIQKLAEVAALAPEPPRKKRPVIAELIASASGPVVAAVPELDEHVDVAAAVIRARALAGGDLDAELEALREGQAAPIEITVEAASAELARQLGGNPVRRGWVAPPPIVEAAPVVAERDLAETKLRDRRLRSRTRSRDLPPIAELLPTIPEPALPIEPEEEVEHEIGDHEVVGETVLANMPFAPAMVEEPDILQPPSLVDDEPEELDADELVEEPQEATYLGVEPEAFADREQMQTQPAFHDDPALADSIDAALAAAEENAAEELADDDILAEADAEDEDLMQASASHDLPAEEAPEQLPHEPDFMARLDFSAEATPLPDPLASFPERDSLADFSDFRRPASETDYGVPTEPEPEPEEPDDPVGRFDIPAIEEDDFHERRAKSPPQISVRTRRVSPEETFTEPPPPEPQRESAPPDDLDDALKALDDDDDLAVPVQKIPTRVPKKRATSDDGILIDFDDDD